MDQRIGKRVKNTRRSVTDDQTLDGLFQTFYDAKIAQGMSPRTLETYLENYAFLAAYLDAVSVARRYEDVTVDVLRSYIAWMLRDKRKWDGHPHKNEKSMTAGLSPVTVNTRLKTLRVMFRFLKAEGYVEQNPMENVRSVTEPEPDVFIMSDEQLKRLLAAPNQRTYAGFRDYVMMTVLIDGFMRIGEVIGIRRADIDTDACTVSLSGKRTKSRKPRIVPLSRATIRLIDDLMRDSDDFASEYVFLTNYGGPITDDQFRNRLKEHAKAAGVEIRIYPHLFRHTAATMFLEDGGDIRHLQKILGHADLRMCERYTHLTNKTIKHQHTQYTPLNRLQNALNKPRKIKR